MSNIPEGHHHCWSQKCECGTINRGCIRFNVKCCGCGKFLNLDYPIVEFPVMITTQSNQIVDMINSSNGGILRK
jgi:hypothetical protein